ASALRHSGRFCADARRRRPRRHGPRAGRARAPPRIRASATCRCYDLAMATTADKEAASVAAAYDTFDDYLKLAIKEYYDRGWKSRRANFIALVIASGQMAWVAKDAVSGEKGLRNVAVGAAGAVALRFALRWALGGPLGILLTAATAASLVAYFVKNQREISQKIGRFRERIAEEKKK